MRFTGKVALVTGSSRNIGKAIAERFASEGAAVVVNARSSQDELEATASEFEAQGYQVLPVLADVADPEAVNDMVAKGIDRFGKIDVLMINHSIRPLREFLKMTHDEWHFVCGVNLHSAMYLCQSVLPSMIEQGGGSIIAVGGDTGGAGRAGLHSYVRPHAFASLAGRTTLLRSLMREFAPKGVRVNFVSPGVMDTVRKNPEWYPADEEADKPPQERRKVLQQIPVGRPGKPAEVADAVLWLASDEAEYVLGTTIGVNGGWGM